ncbi:MAG: oligoendopeptidase F [Verrucomicrobiota bacterium]
MRFLYSDEASGKVRLRSELDPADTWDLDRLYPSNEAWETAFLQYQELYPKYSGFQGRLEEPGVLLECLEFDRECDILVERLYHYASLRTSEDSSDNDHLKREGRLQQALSKSAEVAAFLTPELQAVSDETFEAWLADELLAEWHVSLKKLRRYRPHVLSTKEERILAMASLPLGAAEDAFSQLNNVDLKFGTLEDENGKTIELSHGAYSSFLVKPEQKLRQAAFDQYYQEFHEHRFTIASTLSNSVKADVFNARVRNHPSAVEKSLFSDNMPLSVYENLIATVRGYADAVSEYYVLRREVLGVEELHAYDTYVPMVKDFKLTTSFDEAVELVLQGCQPLGEEYVTVLRDGFADRWVDRYETKGKRSGAFSSSSYGNPPYMLMNYKEDVFSDVYTLAHEAGHSMHSWYSQQHQPYQYYQYPIFLAEVASTFNEELLTHHLLETTDDPKMKAYVINRQIEDIRATLIRQTMFAEFELKIHQAEESGDALTLDTFTGIYRELLEAYHGPELTLDPMLDLECLRIPHFYHAFYVYKYATGISAAIALSQKVLSGGAEDLEAYLGFLKSGGYRYPLETMQLAGVDLSDTAPVVAALDLFKQRVGELGELLV